MKGFEILSHLYMVENVIYPVSSSKSICGLTSFFSRVGISGPAHTRPIVGH